MALGLFDRINFSVALAAKDFQSFFGLSDQDRGVLSSAFFWTYAILQIPGGWIVDRFGVKWPFAVAFVVWSLATAATAGARSVAALLLLRMLLGVGESFLSPTALRWIRLNCPETGRGLAVGIVMSGSKFGPAIGAPLAASLIVSHGWRGMFLLVGLVPLVWIVPWLMLVRHSQSAPKHKDAAPENSPSLRLLRSPAVAGVLLSSFCYQYFIYFCLTWMPAYFVERRGLDLNSMGWYSMFSFSGTAVITALGGYAADRFIARGRRAVNVRKTFAMAGLIGGATELIGAYSQSNEVALFFAIFSLSAVGLTTANHWALAQSLVPAPLAGRIAGLQACAASLPGVAAPLLTGWLKQTTGSYEAPMAAVGVFLAIGICSYLFLVRERS